MARSAKYRLGKDVDLKKELVYDLSGRALTNRGIEQIVKKVRKKAAELERMKKHILMKIQHLIT